MKSSLDIPPQDAAARAAWSQWAPVAWFSLLLAVCYAVVLARLAEQWFINEDMSHGPFVPLLVGYIVWQRRTEFSALAARPAWVSGVGLLLLGGVMLCIGPPSLPTFTFLTRMAFVVSLVGLILLLRGWPTLWRLFYPLLLLGLMIPIPGFLFNKITLPLQFIASRVAEVSLETLGYSVLREGNILYLTGQTLSVAEACSGIRSLLSLTFLGQAYVYLFDPKVWMRAVVAILIVPIAVLANSGRIIFTAVIGAINQEWAHGIYHDYAGWVVFAVAFAALLVVHQFLNRLWSLRHA